MGKPSRQSDPAVREGSAMRRPQLTLDELNQLRWLLGGLLTLIGAGTVVYMDLDAWVLVALTVAVSLVTTFWPTIPSKVPRTVHLLAFPVMAAFFAMDLWLRSELLPAVIRLALLLLIYRATMYRQRRDDLQVIVLGLFLVVVAGVLTVSLAFAVQILVYTACALVLLLLITLIDSAGPGPLRVQEAAVSGGVSSTGNVAAPTSGREPPTWARNVNWGGLFARVASSLDWRVVALGAVLFVGVVAGAALLFLVIPRFQLNNGMFLDRFITKKAKTGFSDSIRFGDVTEILQDTRVALHVDVSDPNQIPASPYWRMLVLDSYENGMIRMSPNLRAARFAQARTGLFVDGIARPRRERTTWTFYLEPGVSRYLPLLGNFRQLRFAEAQTFQRAPGVGLMALVKDPVTMVAYQVDDFDIALLKDAPDPYLPQRAGEGHAGVSAEEWAVLRSHAAEVTGGTELKAGDFARRAETWLRDRHAYTLSPRIPAGPGDPLVRWMSSREAGHCELFAGSVVLLARAAGFPARVVTGFRGGAWNGYSNSFTVRNSDAHAWAEIFDPVTRTWLHADALGVAVLETGAANSPNTARVDTDRSWSARMDSLRVFWYRRVVSFDQQAQAETLKSAKESVQKALLRLKYRFQNGAAEFREWLKRPWNVGRVGRVALAVAFLVGLVAASLWLRRVLRAWLLRRRPERREDPIRREAGRWLRRLEDAGGTRTEQTSVAQIIPDLQRLRFGATRTWPDAYDVFTRARKAAKIARAGKFSLGEASRSRPASTRGR